MKTYLGLRINQESDIRLKWMYEILVDDFNYSLDYLLKLLKDIETDKHGEYLKSLIEESNKEYKKIYSTTARVKALKA